MSRFRWAGTRLPLFMLLGLVLAAGGYKLWRINAELGAISVQASESAALSEGGMLALSQGNPAGIRQELAALTESYRALHSEIGPLAYLGPLFGWIPHYGGDAAQLPALLEYGDSVAASADASSALLGKVTGELDAGRAAGQPLGSALLAAAQKHGQEIQAARAALQQTRALRANLDLDALTPQIQSLVERIDRVLPTWEAALDGMALVPTLLGGDGPHEYLLLAENSDELRAGGGFISSVVRVRIDLGDITGLDFRDSYAVDNLSVPHPVPPAALAKYMDAPYWVVRDANWSPDFPTAARDVSRIYQIDQGLQADGVIAADWHLVPALLEATGPLTVEGYDGQTDATNAVAEMQQYWESPAGQGQTGDWWLHRKDFTGKLLTTILQKLRSGEFDRAALVKALTEALAAKDLVVYLNDPAGEALLQQAGWSGELGLQSSDLLAVVDSNVGYNKVDPSIVRQASYSINLDSSGAGEAVLQLTYQNLSPDTGQMCVHDPYYPPTYVELQQGCYWDYLRIVSVPQARLVASSDGIDAGVEDPVQNRTVMHGYFVLQRGGTREVRYEYRVPAVVVKGSTYRLVIEKQPGAPAWTYQVKVTLPPDWKGFKAEPPPQSVEGNVLRFTFSLDRDQEIVISRQELSAFQRALLFALAGVLLVCVGLLVVLRRRRKAGVSYGGIG